MGKSLNDYASRVAQIIGQPDNVYIRERIKDAIKEYFAKFIIQSIDRNGIHEYYKLSLLVKVTPIEESAVELDDDIMFYREFVSEQKLPSHMNIKNDAPFTRVNIPNTNIYFSYKASKGRLTPSSPPPTCFANKYSIKQNILSLNRNYNSNIHKVSDAVIEEVEVEGIWENPEEVIGYYSIDDNQDYPLPFPEEMMSIILSEVLKVEFGIQPKDHEVNKM